eukprot:CAMPEP_0178998750 /NCGR_PEP_ID=MMETSP0795-20121207/9677_1 /TAXON_ID=88552 /ORGANISM="Amoebophrya sp., Strain Ameob2" /LENGTH=94 /DNA_ID=CAMNT_0020691445 /DNA_START=195 /DNA_END=479 /DNA_ORIENTATION=-
MPALAGSPKKANYQNAAINAQAYMKNSGMERFLNQCVNGCIQQRCNDPYVFMLRKLTQNLSDEELLAFDLERTAKERQLRAEEGRRTTGLPISK